MESYFSIFVFFVEIKHHYFRIMYIPWCLITTIYSSLPAITATSYYKIVGVAVIARATCTVCGHPTMSNYFTMYTIRVYYFSTIPVYYFSTIHVYYFNTHNWSHLVVARHLGVTERGDNFFSTFWLLSY